MSQLLLFPEHELPRQPIYQLFLALFLPSPARDIAADVAQGLRRQHRLRGPPLRTHRLHVSLYGLGRFASVPPHLLEMPGPAVDDLPLAPFNVTFDQALSFKGASRRPLVLTSNDGLAALRYFHQRLAVWVSDSFGVHRLPKSFTPHVTLLYDRQGISPQAIAPVSWTVTDFSLVLSVVGQTRYVFLERWRLTG